MRLCLAALAALVFSCATITPCPHRGGPQWRELTSPHFVVLTDLDTLTAAPIVERLELYRRIMLLAASEDFDPPSRVRVILPSSVGYLRELTGQHEPFWLSFDTDPLMAVSADAFGPRTKELPNWLAVRYAQLLTRTTTPRVPRWFSMGWAAYLQSASINDDLGVADIGLPLAVLVNLQVRGQGFRKTAARLEELWALDETPLPLRWGQTYEWAYFLRYRHPERLAAFLDRLARAEEPRLAWSRVFGDLDAYELEMQAKSFLAPSQTYRYQQLPLPKVSGVASERPLSDAEVHQVRARLLLSLPSDRGIDIQRSAAAAELNDGSPLNGSRALALAKIDAALLPADFQASDPEGRWAWVIARSHEPAHQPTRLQTIERVTAALPQQPHPHLLLARERLLTKDTAGAVTSALRAAQLAPWSAAAATTLAVALAADGKCPAAVEQQRRARELLDDFAPATTIAQTNERLRNFEAGCTRTEALSAEDVELAWERAEGTVLTR